MTDQIERLETASSRLDIDPGNGAVIRSFHIRKEGAWTAALAPSRPSGQPDPTKSACFVMLPWCNRLSAGGVFGANGLHPIAPNWPTTPFPVHGIGWLSAWSVSHRTSKTLSLRLSHDAADPYAFDASMNFSLHPAGFDLVVKIMNTGDHRLPFGIGFHPYFPRSPDLRLMFAARHVALFDDRGLPFPMAPVAKELDFSRGAALGGKALSALYSDAPTVYIEDATTGFRCRLSSRGCAGTQIWAPEAEPYFCVEPVSHLVDDFSYRESSRGHMLSPGGVVKASLSISSD
ncbi:MAG: hypothetical protein HC783_11600 [Rhodobacteraceae bacterium]|nr:hypothetical protein [Paracoccaceae bacterium]